MTKLQALLIAVAILLLFLFIQAVTSTDAGLWPDSALPVDSEELWRLNQ